MIKLSRSFSHVVDMLRVKYGYNHISVFTVASIFKFILLALLQCLYVLSSSLLILSDLVWYWFAVLVICLPQPLHLLNGLLRYLLVLIEFNTAVDLPTRLFLILGAALSQQHLPRRHVIHGFIFVRDEIAFDEGTVFHLDALPVRLFLRLVLLTLHVY